MELESQSCQTACGYRSALSIQTFLTRSLHLKSRCCTLHTCRTDGTLSEGSSKQEQIPAFKMTEVDQDLANNNKYHFSVFFCFPQSVPKPIALEPCFGNKAAVLSIFVRLPRGSGGIPPPGQSGKKLLPSSYPLAFFFFSVIDQRWNRPMICRPSSVFLIQFAGKL